MRLVKAGAVALLAAFCCGCGGTQNGAADEKCKDFDLDVKQVWNAEIRAKVDVAIKQFGGEIGVAGGQEVTTGMDDLTRDWVMLREASCRDHFQRGLISAQEYRGKVACFDEFLRDLRAMVTALEGGEKAAVGQLTTAGAEIERCR